MRRTRHVLAARYERHHYTDRTSVPVTSNAGTIQPGQQSADPSGNAATIRDYPGYQRASRNGTGWNSSINTMTQLSRGGISCYPSRKQREGMAGSKSITER